MQTLTDRQQIKADGIHDHSPVIYVRTIWGLAAEWEAQHGIPAKTIVEQSIKKGDLLAWGTLKSSTLTDDYPGKAAEMARKKQAYEDAPKVENDEVVLIDGRLFRTVVKGAYSDCIHFIPEKKK